MRLGLGVLLLGALCLAAPFAARAQSQQTLENGKKVYDTLCEACHGKYGRGDGPVSSDLKAPLPDFTDPNLLAGRTNAQIADYLTGQTHTPMVVAQTLKRPALLDAISYIRTLSTPGKHVSVAAGKDIYNTFCWVCHGRDGRGDGPAAEHLPGNKPRNFTSPKFVIAGQEEKVAHTITVGAAESIHGSQYMLAWGTRLSPQQIQDVLAYIETFKKAKQ
jgi:mono/diheme cytochrome c family protein